MAVFSIEVPDDQVDRLFAAFTSSGSYDPDSDVSASDFTRKMVINYILDTVSAYERRLAIATAVQALPPAPEIA
jgi:hypothetical protein